MRAMKQVHFRFDVAPVGETSLFSVSRLRRIAWGGAFVAGTLFAAQPLYAEEPIAAVSVVEEPAQTVESASELSVVDTQVLLDLAGAQARALESNPGLLAVAELVAQAQARVQQARSAYFPQVTAGYTATHTELSEQTLQEANLAVRRQTVQQIGQSLGRAFSESGPNAGTSALIGTAFGFYTGSIAYDSIDDGVEQYKAQIVARYLVFDGFTRRFTLSQAKFGMRETEAAQREARRLLLDAVARAYYGVQLSREAMEIFRADLRFNERLLKEAQAARAAGVASLSDELNFEVLLRASQAGLIAAEEEFRTAQVALAALMGLPGAALADGTVIAPLESETEEDLLLPEAEALLARALALRPDVDRSTMALERADSALGARKGVYYPQVGAFLSGDAARSENSRINRDDFSTTVGLNVSYDLFTGGRNRAAVKEARHARREAELRLEEAELQAQSEVRYALERLRTAQQSIVLQRSAAEFVERNRDLVEKEYSVGQAALVRLNQAQRDLVEAQSRLALARVNLKAAWHGLRTATGESLERFPE